MVLLRATYRNALGATLGLALLAPAATAQSTASCPQAVMMACVSDAGSPGVTDMVIHFDTSPGSDANYALLKPHGPKGLTKRCTDSEILIEESTVRFAVDRRTGRYKLVERKPDGAVVEAAGVCTDISAPDAGKPRP